MLRLPAAQVLMAADDRLHLQATAGFDPEQPFKVCGWVAASRATAAGHGNSEAMP